MRVKQKAWFAVLVGLWVAGWAGVQSSPVADFLRLRLEMPVLSHFRKLLNRLPEVDNRIHVVRIDNQTLNRLNLSELSVTEWRRLISNIAAKSPALIIIDKAFHEDGGGELLTEPIKTPVVSAAFFAPRGLIERPNLDMPENEVVELAAQKESFWLDAGVTLRDLHLYAAHPALAPTFAGFGHLHFLPGGEFEPVILTEEAGVVPHLGLYAVLALQNDFDRVENFVQMLGAVRNGGRIAINQVASSKVSASSAVNWLKEGPLPQLDPGKVVIISQDARRTYLTPTGNIDDVVLLTSVVNSVLANAWITDSHQGVVTLFVLGFFALIAAAVWVLPVSAASLTTLAVTTAVAVLSITIFALKAVVVPFLLFQICAIGLAVSLFSLQAYALAERRRRVKQALAGILPEQHLEEITAGRRELDLGPRSRVVTIMQIDIVQFSLASERMSPANAFVELRRMLTEITKIVHAYDGVVDNMMGDRILAFFGYRYDGLKNDRRHAERALECAVRIQRHVATAGNKDATFLPVRIGLNTAPIYAGDLGPNGSIRPTIIGNGINLAKRLEEVCEPFRVLMSMATFDSLPDDLPEEVALMQRRIPIKHAKDLVEVYEVDPFAKDPDTLSKVSAYHRDYLGITRAEERYPISTDTSLKITTNGLEGDLVNFSVNGVAFRIGQYIGKGAVLKLKIEDLHENIEGDLAPFGLQTILCEIKWGRYDDESDRFLHGGRFVNLSPEQAEALFRILRQYSSRRNFGAGEEKAS